MRAAMINHITQVALHYRGKVVAWDVVNEAVADGGQALRASPFLQWIGDALHRRRVHRRPRRRSGRAPLLQRLRRRRDGRQVERRLRPGAGNARARRSDRRRRVFRCTPDRRRFAVGGGRRLQHAAAGGARPRRRHQRDGRPDLHRRSGRPKQEVSRHRRTLCGPTLCQAVTVWGVPDKYSWRNGQSCATPRPLLFNDDYTPKPAYAGVVDAFLGI